MAREIRLMLTHATTAALLTMIAVAPASVAEEAEEEARRAATAEEEEEDTPPLPTHRESITVRDAARVEETDSYLSQRATTATKTDTPLKDVPFAVSTVTRRLVDDQQPVNLGESLRNVAGSQPRLGFGGLNSVPAIRGFAARNLLKDGFRQSMFLPDTDMATVAQVEVVKGPASALYGRFEPGGIVNVVSKKPVGEALAHVDLTAGSDEHYRGTVDLGGPLAGDALRYRLNLVYEDAESYRDLYAMRKAVVAPSLEWRAGDATTVLAEAQWTDRDGGFDRGFLIPATAELGELLLTLPASRNLGEPTDTTRYRGLAGGVTLDHLMTSSWHLRAGAFFSDAHLDDDFFTSGSPLMPDANTYNRRLLLAEDDQRDVSTSVELAGALSTGELTHALLLGVDAGEERYEYLGELVPTISPIDPFAPVYGEADYGPPIDLWFDGVDRHRAMGLFVQDEMAFGERWRVLAGARYDEIEEDRLTRGEPDDRTRRTDGEVSPRLGLTYALTPAISAYASYARSFQPQIGGAIFAGWAPEPSRGTQYETGIKADLLRGRLFATAALYDLAKTNVLVPDPDNPGFSLQIGEQQSRGVELEVIARPHARWNLIASYAYNDAEISRDTDSSLVGNRLAAVPEHTASLWSTYRFDQGWSRGLEVGAGAFHVSARPVNNANLFDLPSYTRVDAMTAYAWSQWRIALNLQNLTDEKYFDSTGTSFYPMPPRRWFASAGYRF